MSPFLIGTGRIPGVLGQPAASATVRYDVARNLVKKRKLIVIAFSADNQQILVKWSGLPDHNNPWQIECEIKPVILWNLLRKQLRDSQRKTNAERMPASDTGSPASRRNHSQVSLSAELLRHESNTAKRETCWSGITLAAQATQPTLDLCRGSVWIREVTLQLETSWGRSPAFVHVVVGLKAALVNEEVFEVLLTTSQETVSTTPKSLLSSS
ncbi:hypothetical protein GN244_ATG04352 [Phytophthora infestans]|uniref:Chromo domain-containing protein n=1 Tax=Phytophthora infestans TaxID=4787 RepID=A0A833WZA8_PHYIN|nr:hypothetical protein GN244_ATG04352 [Phytophthora infestans]KAF4145975.1 hypothetical protein GN958_ATG04798 [Phytophthora infestans]